MANFFSRVPNHEWKCLGGQRCCSLQIVTQVKRVEIVNEQVAESDGWLLR